MDLESTYQLGLAKRNLNNAQLAIDTIAALLQGLVQEPRTVAPQPFVPPRRVRGPIPSAGTVAAYGIGQIIVLYAQKRGVEFNVDDIAHWSQAQGYPFTRTQYSQNLEERGRLKKGIERHSRGVYKILR